MGGLANEIICAYVCHKLFGLSSPSYLRVNYSGPKHCTYCVVLFQHGEMCRLHIPTRLEMSKLVKCRKMGENIIKLPSSNAVFSSNNYRWSVVILRWWEPKTRELQWNMKKFNTLIGRIKLTKLDGLGNWRHKMWCCTVRLLLNRTHSPHLECCITI